MKKYHGLFTCAEDVASEFRLTEDYLKSIHIVYASYDVCGYEGEAFVIFIEDDELFEVNAGHCSCYGLEGQWHPSSTSYECLLQRPNVPEEAKELIRLSVN